MSSQNGSVVVFVNVLACGQPKCKQCWTTGQSDFLVRDWLMMLMMSSTNGGLERHKVRLVLVDEFLSVYSLFMLTFAGYHSHKNTLGCNHLV